MTDPEQDSCKISSVLRAHPCCKYPLLILPSAQQGMSSCSVEAWLRVCGADSDSPSMARLAQHGARVDQYPSNSYQRLLFTAASSTRKGGSIHSHAGKLGVKKGDQALTA